jgi:DNA mismatch repair protein MutS
MVDDLPLFSAAVRRAPPKPASAPASDALHEAVASLHPDEMTPKEALDALYRLKGLAGR